MKCGPNLAEAGANGFARQRIRDKENKMDKMKAIVFHDVGKIELTQLPIPHVKEPDDVLLKVHAVGICGSDIKIIEGKHHFKPDTVLGHEFCGEVVEVGSHVHHMKV